MPVRASPFHPGASVPPRQQAAGRHEQAGGRTSRVGIGRRWSRWRSALAGKVAGFFASFAGVASDNYWSSTTNETNPTNAWNANLDNGNVNNNDKDNTLRVWPVRGGAWRPCGP